MRIPVAGGQQCNRDMICAGLLPAAANGPTRQNQQNINSGTSYCDMADLRCLMRLRHFMPVGGMQSLDNS